MEVVLSSYPFRGQAGSRPTPGLWRWRSRSWSLSRRSCWSSGACSGLSRRRLRQS